MGGVFPTLIQRETTLLATGAMRKQHCPPFSMVGIPWFIAFSYARAREGQNESDHDACSPPWAKALHCQQIAGKAGLESH
tara:strand:- start:274 stop:513 length:240 start_codon:yes stop_codon:yes gene_type:complete